MERPGWRKERRETEAHARGKHFAILRPRTRATADIRATVPRAQLPTGGHVTGVHGIVCLWPAAHTQPSLEDPVVSAYMSALRDLVLSPTLYFLSSFLPSNFMWMDSSFLYLSFWGLDIECSPPCLTDKKSKKVGRKGRETVFWRGNRCDISKPCCVSGWSDPGYQVTRHRVEALLSRVQCHQSRARWQHWLPLKNILKIKGQNHLFLRVNEFTESWLHVPRRLSTNPDDCSKTSRTSSRQRKTF